MDIITEMLRKPDADLLLDWIWDRTHGEDADGLFDIGEAIDAYREGLEG